LYSQDGGDRAVWTFRGREIKKGAIPPKGKMGYWRMIVERCSSDMGIRSYSRVVHPDPKK